MAKCGKQAERGVREQGKREIAVKLQIAHTFILDDL